MMEISRGAKLVNPSISGSEKRGPRKGATAMKTKFTLVLACILLVAAGSTVLAESKLHLKVITGSPEGFWVNSTLVYGEKDAILIDAPFTQIDALRVAMALLESKKNLTTVYVTHGHPDHYFGLGIIRQVFPNAKLVAIPAVVEDAKQTGADKIKVWKPMYGDNLTANLVLPEAMAGTTLTLEGETLQIVTGIRGDTMSNSTYIWIPSLKAVISGDIVFAGLHPWTAESTPATRKEWIKALESISALKPEIVVPGHKNPALKDDPSSLVFMKDYLTYFDEALAAAGTRDEFVAKVKGKYPNLGLDIILNLGADASFKEKMNKEKKER
jgi:glyoxylase-like metal-dependent hydrolase (beta-lactamase superfamily II)